MVIVDSETQPSVIQLLPNRSLSWRHNKLILLSIIIVSSFISLRFILIGAWVVALFCLVELILVGAAFYYVSWKLAYREVISTSDDNLILEKGVYMPSQSWQWQKSKVFYKEVIGTHPLDTPQIYIVAPKEIRIGCFLNAEDCAALLSYLRKIGLQSRYTDVVNISA